MSTTIISPEQLAGKLQETPSMELIDVRTPAEFREVHVVGAKNIPLDRLDPGTLQASQPHYVICRSGARGEQARMRLVEAGISHVINVEGGTQACELAGLPVVRGKKAMSLERQVRIAAGTLVVLGVLLGSLIHPYFVGLSAFVGAGLVFAGITDTCGMGMLLAKMPWNQVSESCEVK